jgi:hypothetical protein
VAGTSVFGLVDPVDRARFATINRHGLPAFWAIAFELSPFPKRYVESSFASWWWQGSDFLGDPVFWGFFGSV